MATDLEALGFMNLKNFLSTKTEEKEYYLDGEVKIAAGQVCIITSAPGVGKSYLSELMAIVLAGGKDWFGKFTAPVAVPVLYILTDGSEEDLKERVAGPEQLGYVDDLTWYNLYLSSTFPLNLTTNGKESRAALTEVIEQTGAKIVFIDSLYSSMQGDPSDGAIGIKLAQELKDLKNENPDVAWVILHHNKKASLTSEGNVMKDPNPFLGSQYLNAMIDHMWNYERSAESTSAKLTQLKARALKERWDPWHVNIDLETGVLTPQGHKSTPIGQAMRTYFKSSGEVSTKQIEAWGQGKGFSKSAVNEHRKLLQDDGMVEAVEGKRAAYQWVVHSVTVKGEERTLDLDTNRA